MKSKRIHPHGFNRPFATELLVLTAFTVLIPNLLSQYQNVEMDVLALRNRCRVLNGLLVGTAVGSSAA